MVVDGSEHFESQVIHHFDAVNDLDIVGQLIINNS